MTTARKPRLLFYFLHLLGVGHVYRAKRLIEGFASAGIDVDIIYGGAKIDETFKCTSIRYLPAIRAASADYKDYLDEHGNALTAEYLESRKQELLTHFKTLDVDLVLTEAFPFGRRMVRRELAALLEATRQCAQPPLIVSSVRDILQEGKKTERLEETRDWIRDWFDHVLVHSDPDIIALDKTFPLTADITEKLSYTGFVVPEHNANADVASYDIIVTAGGGGFGADLLKVALKIARTDRFSALRWCLATGPHMPATEREKLADQKSSNVDIVERLDGLADHLAKAKLSISQCGYNTAMDVLSVHSRTDCRAVFVPYDTQGQSEQARRAELLEKAGYAINLPQSNLTPATLSDAMESALLLPRVDHKINFQGVENSARLVRSWIDAHRLERAEP